MITRIVKMTFKPEMVPSFLAVFAESSSYIRGFKGCKEMSLMQATHDPNIYYTYSIWESEEDLHHYRNSTRFREIWTATKACFAAAAEATSLQLIDAANQ
jgi:heme-degrading monooxygenase HmoA